MELFFLKYEPSNYKDKVLKKKIKRLKKKKRKK